ncbi:hypothetical protein F9278_45910 [Streptomyces phaeolivaceus]|uniref:Uncharacterized protein n=1 Tax=Streptomyces phaeolivaceus TaxID=2653200 RepID=A0A5P8KI49_9ACTN|nr:hypothetical protein [Streptomyces phaeolivaceus]QFR02268.1 hypothetical protein F9278_45910 [Streptomyces phaeolivaceus]
MDYDRSLDPGAGDGELSTPAADVAFAAGQVLFSGPSDSDRAVAYLPTMCPPRGTSRTFRSANTLSPSPATCSAP